MWHKSEDSKLKSSPSAFPSPHPSVGPPGVAGPTHGVGPSATVSRGIKIKGDISGQGDLFIDGTLEGKVHIPDGNFAVGPNARVSADIEAREIIIQGEVVGTLKAHGRIQILSTAIVTGDIETRGIVVEDGAVLHSRVAVPQTRPQSAVPEEDQGTQRLRSEDALRTRVTAAGALVQPGRQEP